MTSYINKENFPPNTRIIAKQVGFPSEKEFLCVEWSPAGRCKIYDRIENQYFWTLLNPKIEIVELLPDFPSGVEAELEFASDMDLSE